MSWDTAKTVFIGMGTVEYVTGEGNTPVSGCKPGSLVYPDHFAAQLYACGACPSQLLFKDADVKALDIVRRLTEEPQDPPLLTAMVFTTPDGTRTLRLKNGNLIPLTDTDVVTEPTSGNVYVNGTKVS